MATIDLTEDEVTKPASGSTPDPETTDAIQLDTEALGDTLKRLKRAQGQIGGIVQMIEDGRDCTDIITQMAAVSKALDRVGFALIANSLKQCLAQDPTSEGISTTSLQRLFLSLA